jgi:citrate lyase subunit beta / citryl-CoA lyase
MVEKAASSAADQVFVDLEDAVAPSEKKAARALVVESLNSLDFGGKVVVVRVNDVTTPFCHGDILALVADAGAKLDCLMIPKVHDASHVHFVDHLLSGLEDDLGLTRPIGLELQIETPHGAIHLVEIAKASKRTQTIVFGPGDYAVSLGVPQLELGMIDPDYPGHQWHWVMSEVANHARAVGAQAIDGPYVDFKDREGYRESARRAKLLGFDGKWCIHPNQIEWANEVFTPSDDQYHYAERLLEAYREATDAGRGAVVFDGKMIDEATRKMAERVAARGRAAGLSRLA